MPVTQRRLSTVAIAVSTAAIVLSLSGGGPAIAASVVDFAKNAGAVDGKSAVAANAGVNQRKGKLVATGGTTGQLPNNIIAQAPDSAKLGGVPLAALAPAILTGSAGPIALTTTPTEFCQTKVLTTTTASVATVEGDLNIGANAPANAAMHIEISVDGAKTWNNIEANWSNAVSVSTDTPTAAVSHVTSVAIPAHTRVAFALALGSGVGKVPTAAECSLTALVLHRTPGAVLSTNPILSTTTPGTSRLLGGGR